MLVLLVECDLIQYCIPFHPMQLAYFIQKTLSLNSKQRKPPSNSIKVLIILYKQQFTHKNLLCMRHRPFYSELDPSNQDYSILLSQDSQILRERSPNIHNLPNNTSLKASLKRSTLHKKAFSLKYQRGLFQPMHNDYTPHSILSPNASAQYKGSSNIEILKKEIEYLQQSSTDTDQFPKGESLIQKMRATQCEHTRVKTTDINFESIGFLPKQKKKISLFQNFSKSGSGKFLAPPRKERPGSEEKSMRKHVLGIKKSSKNTICGKTEEKENEVAKSGKKKVQLIAPFRKYFQANRSKRNASCSIRFDQIFHKKLTQMTRFDIQDAN